MNFLWFQGSESLFVNESGTIDIQGSANMINVDPSCNLTGFLQPNQTTCLLCRPGYYLQENACVSEPSEGYFFHNETGSYQSNLMSFPTSNSVFSNPRVPVRSVLRNDSLLSSNRFY